MHNENDTESIQTNIIKTDIIKTANYYSQLIFE